MIFHPISSPTHITPVVVVGVHVWDKFTYPTVIAGPLIVAGPFLLVTGLFLLAVGLKKPPLFGERHGGLVREIPGYFRKT